MLIFNDLQVRFMGRKKAPLRADALRATLRSMKPTEVARRLRREQTAEEKQLGRALRAGRFAGFKFRRQHPIGGYFLDFYCPLARLAVELDGFQHGTPKVMRRDEDRERFLAQNDVETHRFWNRQWHANREGVLLEIWNALQRRSGCTKVMRKLENHRYVPSSLRELRQNKGPDQRQNQEM